MVLVALVGVGLRFYTVHQASQPKGRCKQCETLWYDERFGNNVFSNVRELREQANRINHGVKHHEVSAGGRQWTTEYWEMIYFNRHDPHVKGWLAWYAVNPTPPAIRKFLGQSNGLDLVAGVVPHLIEKEALSGRIRINDARAYWELLKRDSEAREGAHDTVGHWATPLAKLSDYDLQDLALAILWAFQNQPRGLDKLEITLKDLAVTHPIKDPVHGDFEARTFNAPEGFASSLTYPASAKGWIDLNNIDANRVVTRHRILEYLTVEAARNPTIAAGEAVEAMFGLTLEQIKRVREASPIR